MRVSRWGHFADGSLTTVLPMKETKWYKDDLCAPTPRTDATRHARRRLAAPPTLLAAPRPQLWPEDGGRGGEATLQHYRGQPPSVQQGATGLVGQAPICLRRAPLGGAMDRVTSCYINMTQKICALWAARLESSRCAQGQAVAGCGGAVRPPARRAPPPCTLQLHMTHETSRRVCARSRSRVWVCARARLACAADVRENRQKKTRVTPFKGSKNKLC